MSKKKKIVQVVSVLLLVVIAFLYYIIWGTRPKVKIEVFNAKNISISCDVDKNAEFYRIYRSDEKEGQYERIGTVRENKFIDKDLKPSTTYWYKVVVVKDGKEGKLSSPASGTTKDLPPTPVNVSSDSITFESAAIRWNKVDNVINYYIYRADDENNHYNMVGQSTENRFVDGKLSPSKKYKYKIVSYNQNGESEPSSELIIETAEKVNQRGNSTYNLMNGGYAAEQGNWIYYTDKATCNGTYKSLDNALYKVKKDGTCNTKIYHEVNDYNICGISSINVVGDWIYFEKEDAICKIRTDGSGFSIIRDEIVGSFYVIGDWIYFKALGIHKIKTDGSRYMKITSDKPAYFAVEGDWIYYSNWEDNRKLYKMKTDGSNKQCLSEHIVNFISISGESIYYGKAADKMSNNISSIYKVRADGAIKQKIIDCNAGDINITDDAIVYENLDADGRLFKVRIDGNYSAPLTDSHYNKINIVNNQVYCYDFDNGNKSILELKKN